MDHVVMLTTKESDHEEREPVENASWPEQIPLSEAIIKMGGVCGRVNQVRPTGTD